MCFLEPQLISTTFDTTSKVITLRIHILLTPISIAEWQT